MRILFDNDVHASWCTGGVELGEFRERLVVTCNPRLDERDGVETGAGSS